MQHSQLQNKPTSRFEAGNAAFPASNRDLSQGSTYTYIDIYTYIYMAQLPVNAAFTASKQAHIPV